MHVCWVLHMYKYIIDNKCDLGHVFRMRKTLPMESYKNYNLSANEAFVIFLTSKLIACFIDRFTSKMKSQSIAFLLNGSENIHWILDLDDEVHPI